MIKIVDNAIAFPNFARNDIFKYLLQKQKEGSLKMLISCVFYPKKKMHTQANAYVCIKRKTHLESAPAHYHVYMESCNHKRALFIERNWEMFEYNQKDAKKHLYLHARITGRKSIYAFLQVK